MSATRRFNVVLALVALVALGIAAFEYAGDREDDRRLHTDTRAPVANPPVDPNRPDLLEEPTIANECQSNPSEAC